MDEILLEEVEHILILSNNYYTEEEYETWKMALSYIFYSGTSGHIPKTEMEKRFAAVDFERGIEHMKKVLERLPPEVLGEDVKWDRVCFGFLTPLQKENLQKYYDERKQQ